MRHHFHVVFPMRSMQNAVNSIGSVGGFLPHRIFFVEWTWICRHGDVRWCDIIYVLLCSASSKTCHLPYKSLTFNVRLMCVWGNTRLITIYWYYIVCIGSAGVFMPGITTLTNFFSFFGLPNLYGKHLIETIYSSFGSAFNFLHSFFFLLYSAAP